jgi:Flp pilus assembly pilin Flp
MNTSPPIRRTSCGRHPLASVHAVFGGRLAGRRPARPRSRGESGQASVEYALVLLGAALVATLLIGWATKTQLLGDLFDHVLSLIRGKAQ